MRSIICCFVMISIVSAVPVMAQNQRISSETININIDKDTNVYIDKIGPWDFHGVTVYPGRMIVTKNEEAAHARATMKEHLIKGDASFNRAVRKYGRPGHAMVVSTTMYATPMSPHYCPPVTMPARCGQYCSPGQCTCGTQHMPRQCGPYCSPGHCVCAPTAGPCRCGGH